MSELDSYISIFKKDQDKNKKTVEKAGNYFSLSLVLVFILLLISQLIKNLEFLSYLLVPGFLAIIIAAFFLARAISRIPLAGKLAYSLSQVYEEINEIKEIGDKGPLTEKRRKKLLSNLVSGPIKRLESMIELRNSAPKYLLFKEREISLLNDTKEFLITRVYPSLKEGKDDKVQRYLGPLIKNLIDLNFGEYEVALSRLGKEIPEARIEIPEMITYTDNIKNFVRARWNQSIIFRFLVLCVGIGVILYLVSFAAKIEIGQILVITIPTSAVLATASGIRKG